MELDKDAMHKEKKGIIGGTRSRSQSRSRERTGKEKEVGSKSRNKCLTYLKLSELTLTNVFPFKV